MLNIEMTMYSDMNNLIVATFRCNDEETHKPVAIATANIYNLSSYDDYEDMMVWADNESMDNHILLEGYKKINRFCYDTMEHFILIKSLQVLDNRFRQGYGSRLLNLITAWVESNYPGAVILLLSTPIKKDGKKINKKLTQKGLNNFYENNGFIVIKVLDNGIITRRLNTIACREI